MNKQTWAAFWWGFFHPFATKQQHYDRAIRAALKAGKQ